MPQAPQSQDVLQDRPCCAALPRGRRETTADQDTQATHRVSLVIASRASASQSVRCSFGGIQPLDQPRNCNATCNLHRASPCSIVAKSPYTSFALGSASK